MVSPQCGSGICVISGGSPALRGLLWASWSGGDGNTCPRLPAAVLGVRCYHGSGWGGTGQTTHLRSHGVEVQVSVGRQAQPLHWFPSWWWLIPLRVCTETVIIPQTCTSFYCLQKPRSRVSANPWTVLPLKVAGDF